MKRDETVFDYMGQIFMIFGVTILCLNIFCLLFGEDAKGLSTMFALVLLTIVLFIIFFGWFPVDMWQAWLMFFLCFGISVAVSTVISALKEKSENKKLEEALGRLKQREGQSEEKRGAYGSRY